jgi:hypothetical protein
MKTKTGLCNRLHKIHFRFGINVTVKSLQTGKRREKAVMISSQPNQTNFGKNGGENFMPAKYKIHSASCCERNSEKSPRAGKRRKRKLLWFHSNLIKEILLKTAAEFCLQNEQRKQIA